MDLNLMIQEHKTEVLFCYLPKIRNLQFAKLIIIPIRNFAAPLLSLAITLLQKKKFDFLPVFPFLIFYTILDLLSLFIFNNDKIS